MRRLHIDQLARLVLSTRELTKDRPPKPFAKIPTRVGWYIEANLGHPAYAESVDGELRMNPGRPDWRTLEYIGKPSRYRALEALNLLKKSGGKLLNSWQCEFDRAGLVALVNLEYGTVCSDAYFAYHPQGGEVSPMAAFAKPVYLKKIGKFPTYSHQKRLSQEQIDQYYMWFEETFNSKTLKRPRKKKAAFDTPVSEQQPAAPGFQYQVWTENAAGTVAAVDWTQVRLEEETAAAMRRRELEVLNEVLNRYDRRPG